MPKSKIELRLSSLQVALLTILLQAGEQRVTLGNLAKQVYHRAGKTKPENARHSVAALIRGTATKVKNLSAQITRHTPRGRGNLAEYSLGGNLANVQACVAWNIERFNEA